MDIKALFQRGLNLAKLRSFFEVAQSGSVTRAANGDPSRRSLISRQISELEATLGFHLLRRTGRSIEVTEAGRELALLTAAYFAELQELTKRAIGTESQLRLGSGSSIFESLVFPNLRNLQRNFPNVSFEYQCFSSPGAIQALQDGAIDLGIIRANHGGSGLTEIPLGQMEFVLIGRSDFDTNIGRWSLREFLSRVPLTLINGHGDWISTFMQVCRKLEVKPSVAHRVENFGHVREFLRAGAPGGFLPVELASALSETNYIMIDDDHLKIFDRPLVIAYDTRAARVRDRLQQAAELLANVLTKS